MGALDQATQQEPVPSQLAGSPVYDIMAKMSQNMSQTMDQTSQFPEQMAQLGQQRQSALQQVQQATEAQANAKSPSKAFIDGWASQILSGHPDNAVPYGMWAETQQRESSLGGNVATAKLGYDDITGQQKTLEDIYKTQMMATGMKGGLGGMVGMLKTKPIKLADGTWGAFNSITGQVTPLAQADQAVMQKQYTDAYKLGQKILNTDDPTKLHQFAIEQLQTQQDIRTNNPVTGMTPQGVAPIQPSAPPPGLPGSQGKIGTVGTPGTEVLIPETQKSGMLAQLKEQEDAAVAAGDYARAIELQKASKAIIASSNQASGMGAAPLPTSNTGPRPGMPVSQQPITTPGAGMQLRTPELKANQEALGKARQKYEDELVTENTTASNVDPEIQRLQKYMVSVKDSDLGPASPYIQKMRSWANELGVPLNEADLASMNSLSGMQKVSMTLATQLAKQISSRPTQAEYMKLLETATPNMLLPSREAFEIVANAIKERASTQHNKLAEWNTFKGLVPVGKGAPADFEQYWGAKTSNPAIWGGVTYEDIVHTAQKRGLTPAQVITEYVKKKSGGK